MSGTTRKERIGILVDLWQRPGSRRPGVHAGAGSGSSSPGSAHSPWDVRRAFRRETPEQDHAQPVVAGEILGHVGGPLGKSTRPTAPSDDDPCDRSAEGPAEALDHAARDGIHRRSRRRREEVAGRVAGPPGKSGFRWRPGPGQANGEAGDPAAGAILSGRSRSRPSRLSDPRCARPAFRPLRDEHPFAATSGRRRSLGAGESDVGQRKRWRLCDCRRT